MSQTPDNQSSHGRINENGQREMPGDKMKKIANFDALKDRETDGNDNIGVAT